MENTATAPADRVLSYFDVDTYGENADPAMRALQTPRLRGVLAFSFSGDTGLYDRWTQELMLLARALLRLSLLVVPLILPIHPHQVMAR